MCTAAHVRAGDTATIGAILSTTYGFGSITYKFVSGPNTPIITPIPLTASSFTTGNIAQQNATVTGLVSGTYIIQVIGMDKNGTSIPGTDSIVVSPACPIVPAPRIATTIQVLIMGQWITVPAGDAKLIYNDGSVQNF